MDLKLNRTGRGRIGVHALVLATALASFTVLGRAETPGEAVIEGHVIALEQDDLIVDLAGKSGAVDGDVVELWRPIKLRHPITGKIVTDRFRIGSLRLTEVRDTLALAVPSGKLSRTPQAGDVAILRKARPVVSPTATAKPKDGTAATATAAPTCTTAPGTTAPGVTLEDSPEDPEAAEVASMFDELRGADPTRRIVTYERYVKAKPRGRFAAVLYEEAAQLREYLKLSEAAHSEEQPSAENFEPPTESIAGEPLTFAIELRGPVSGAVLHSRNDGEAAYISLPMTEVGDGYFSVTVPANRMNAPRFEYFIEAVNARGEAVEVIGAQRDPKRVRVAAMPKPTPPPRLPATLRLWTDYADYNRWRHDDFAWQTEGDAGMRYGDEGVRALRTGFGVYRGKGGSVDELDVLGLRSRAVGLTYGYLELEYGFSGFTSLILRGVVGLNDDGVAGGSQALIRLGNDQRTNLVFGGEVLGGVGVRGITELNLNIFERVPILLRTEVTNQPAGASRRTLDADGNPLTDVASETSEIGARAIVQAGYRLTPNLTVALRGSYQGRTIDHSGPGFGGAVMYSW